MSTTTEALEAMMTSEELEAIRERCWSEAPRITELCDDRDALLAEVERLRAKLERVEGLVEDWDDGLDTVAEALREALSGGEEGV